MTKEEKDLKDLLLKDLCGRLPYGVKLFSKFVDGLDTKEVVGRISQIDDSMVLGIANEPNNEYSFTYVAIHEAKPYLFPLSSMTEEQKEEFNSYFASVPYYGDNIHIPYYFVELLIDFYNKHHLDWRGLIPMGLAIDATGLNIYKEE